MMKKKIYFPLILVLLLGSIITSNDLLAKAPEAQKKSLIVTISAGTFSKEIEKNVVLVDYWAPWCGPCRRMNPILEELSLEYEGSVKIAKLNIDDNKKFAINQGIESIPAMIVYKDGKEMTRVIGQVSKEDLKKVLNEYIKK